MDGQICGTKCLIPKVKIMVKIVKKTGDFFSYYEKCSTCSKHRDETILPAGGRFEEVKKMENSKTVIIKSGPIGCLQKVAIYWRFQL